MEKNILNLIDVNKSDIKYRFINNQFLDYPTASQDYRLEFTIDNLTDIECGCLVLVKTRINTPDDLFKLDMVGRYLNNIDVCWCLEIFNIMYDGMELDKQLGGFESSYKLVHPGKIIIDAISRLNPYKIGICSPITRWYVSQFKNNNVGLTDITTRKVISFNEDAFEKVRKCGFDYNEILICFNNIYGFYNKEEEGLNDGFKCADKFYYPGIDDCPDRIKTKIEKGEYKAFILVDRYCSEKNIKTFYSNMTCELKMDGKFYLCSPRYFSNPGKRCHFEKIFTTNAHDDDLKPSQDIDVYDIINADNLNN